MSFFLGFAKGLQFSMDQKLQREKMALDKEKFEMGLQAERENILLRGKVARENADYSARLTRELNLEEETRALYKEARTVGFSSASIAILDEKDRLAEAMLNVKMAGDSYSQYVKAVEDSLSVLSQQGVSNEAMADAVISSGPTASSAEIVTNGTASTGKPWELPTWSDSEATSISTAVSTHIMREASLQAAAMDAGVRVLPDTGQLDFVTAGAKAREREINAARMALYAKGIKIFRSSGGDLSQAILDMSLSNEVTEPTTPMPGTETPTGTSIETSEVGTTGTSAPVVNTPVVNPTVGSASRVQSRVTPPSTTVGKPTPTAVEPVSGAVTAEELLRRQGGM